MGRGIRVGRVGGIPLMVNLSWFVSLVVIVVVARSLWEPLTGLGAYALSLAFALALFASVLAHELSHALVARALGIPTADITLFVFGGVARITHEPDDAGDEVLVAVAGPLTSVTLAGVLLLGAWFLPGTIGDLVTLTGLANLTVGLFNLLPGFPLDGGRVARAVLWHLSGRRLLATQITAWAGRGLAATLITAGVAAGIAWRRPEYLLHILLGVFLWQAAAHGERIARHIETLRNRTVRDYMTVPAAVPAWARIADLAARGLTPTADGQRVVVVAAGNRPIGLLEWPRLATVPPVQWPSVAAGQLAEPVAPDRLVGANTRADIFFSRYLTSPEVDYLVLEADGSFAGMVDRPAGERLRTVLAPPVP